MAERNPIVGAQHIAPGGEAGGKKYEPLRKNHFRLNISGLPGSADSDTIGLALVSFPVPTVAVERTSIDFGNEQRHVAGGATIEQANLTVVDYIDPDTAEYLFEWFKEVYDPDTGKVGLAADYKKDGSVVLYDPEGTEVREWSLSGIFPTNFNQGEFSMSARGEVQQIQMQLSVDLIQLGGAGSQ